ncbi:ABC transporter permease subunit [bacterium]|jgi:microcin C transport system permease protein|nr:ABC transporter permease subunit [bacterium]
MFEYFVRRFLALFVTLFGITLIGFVIINLAPGGPIEQKLQQMRFGVGGGESSAHSMAVTQEVIDELKRQYGFDKPLLTRYGIWLKNLASFDFGKSFYFEEPVTQVILRKIPVSLQFGVATFLLSYLICVPLGIFKAVRHGTPADSASSAMLFVAYSVPSFMLAILLIVLFGGGSFFSWFPIAGVSSDNYESLSFFGKVGDRLHHFVLPLTCYVIGHFASLTLLMKNSVLEEIKKDYVRTARAKGLREKWVVYKHVLRNALIPIATGLGHFLSVFFAGSLLIETIFSIDGMGLLSFQAILSRDYNVVMGLLVMESFLFLLGNILSDLLYVVVDPRVDFHAV